VSEEQRSEEYIDAIRTRWSLVRLAHLSEQNLDVGQARQRLVMRYAAAIRRYVGAIVRDQNHADEISQDVILRLIQGDFSGADPQRGRFRDLLKASIRNRIRDYFTYEGRRKSIALDFNVAIHDSEDRPDQRWLHIWQKVVFEQTWSRLLEDEGGKPTAGYLALKLKTEFPDRTSEELSEELSRRTKTEIRADRFRQLLHRTRKRFAAVLVDEVKSCLDEESDERLEEELSALELLEFVREYLRSTPE
jgi:DNA-directed RNA polymerase specialized sigma24 family protein